MKFATLLALSILLFLNTTVQPACAMDRADKDALRILVLGDSLTAGSGLSIEDAFPNQLQRALLTAGHPVRVINSGVSGDTTAGGLSRLEWALSDQPHIVILELGGNDALRGLNPEQTRDNLERIIVRLKQAGVNIMLAGMLAPRNLGPDYYNKFDKIYPDLAAKHEISLYPFFLDGVVGDPQLNLEDGIHPNRRGVGVIVEKILPYVEDMIRDTGNRVSLSFYSVSF